MKKLALKQIEKNATLTIANIATSTVIGTAAATVDLYRSFNITQTTANITLSLSNPSNDASTPFDVTVRNTGSTTFVMYGALVPVGATIIIHWNTLTWQAINFPIKVSSTLFIDANEGNNSFAQRGRQDKPFSTWAGAMAVAVAGDTIVVRNGSYAFGTAPTVSGLTVLCDSGVKNTSGTLTLNTGISLNWFGGIIDRMSSTNSVFKPMGDNVKLIIKADSYAQSNARLLDITGITGTLSGLYVDIDIPLMDSGAGVTPNYIFSGNAAGCDLSASTIRIKSGYIGKNNLFFRCRNRTNSYFVLYADTVDTTYGGANNIFLISGTCSNSGNSVIDVDINNLISANTNPSFSISGESYGCNGSLRIGFATCVSPLITVLKGIGSQWNIEGYRHTMTGSSTFSFYDFAQSIANPGAATTPLIGVINVEYVYNTYATSKTSGAGYGTANTIVSANYGTNLRISSKRMVNAKNEVIGIDHNSPQTPNVDVFPTVVEIYGTYMEKTARDGGAGYNGVIFYDRGDSTQNHGIARIKLYNGASFMNGGDAFVLGGTGLTPGFSEMYIDLMSPVTAMDASGAALNYQYAAKINHLYRETVNISAAYTVKDSDEAIYMTVPANYTVSLPDPTTCPGRILYFKIVATSAFSATLDATGTLNIDNANTLVLSAATLANATLQSNGTGWFTL